MHQVAKLRAGAPATVVRIWGNWDRTPALESIIRFVSPYRQAVTTMQDCPYEPVISLFRRPEV